MAGERGVPCLWLSPVRMAVVVAVVVVVAVAVVAMALLPV